MGFTRIRGSLTRLGVAGVLLFGMPVSLLSPEAQAAGPASSSIALSEVSCEADWIELVNTGTRATADIGGWLISQDAPAPEAQRFTFPSGTKVAAGGRRVVQVSSLPFRIGCGENHIYLSTPDASVVDETTVPNLKDGFTWGRVGSEWMATKPTKAKANIKAAATAVVDRAAWIFSPMKSFEIMLTADPADLQKLVTDPLNYVPATFRMKDDKGRLYPASGPIAVGIRAKGSRGSRTAPSYGPNGLDIVEDKVGIKIKFNYSVPGQHFLGLERMTLNNMVQDETMTHDILSYKLFRDMGLIAPRTGFANVFINGSRRGLFLNLEPYDDISLAWHIPDLQHAYEGEPAKRAVGTTSVLQYPDFVPEAIGVAFTADAGDKQNSSDLVALISTIDSSTVLSPAAIAHLDLEQMGTFFALEKFIVHWDGYSGSVPWVPNNFYLASNASGRFVFMPAGTDSTWVRLKGVEGMDANGMEPLGSAGAMMFARCLSNDRCASAYRRTLASAVQRAPEYKRLALQLMSVHRAARLADTLRLNNEEAVQWGWKQMLYFFEQRPKDVAAYLKDVVTTEIRWIPLALQLNPGTPLTSHYLNAYSDIPGTFKYSVKTGTKLRAGVHTVGVTFTPLDPQASSVKRMSRTFTVG